VYKLDWTFILIIIKKFKKLYNNKTLHTWNAFFLIRVFKPGLSQDLGESPGSILIFFNQNDVVLVKNKQKSTGCNRVFDWILPDPPCHRVNPPGHTDFWLSLFFLKSDPIPAPARPNPGSTRRAGLSFKTMLWTIKWIPSNSFFFH
jgi:hypothetical protein